MQEGEDKWLLAALLLEDRIPSGGPPIAAHNCGFHFSFLVCSEPSLLFWGCFHLVETSTEFLTPMNSRSQALSESSCLLQMHGLQ